MRQQQMRNSSQFEEQSDWETIEKYVNWTKIEWGFQVYVPSWEQEGYGYLMIISTPTSTNDHSSSFNGVNST